MILVLKYYKRGNMTYISHIDLLRHFTRAFLLREREKAYRAECTPGCDKGCQGCGAMALAACDEVKR